MELPVLIASNATLRLLWQVQISRGAFSLEWPSRVPTDARVDLVLVVDERRIVLPARVRSCTPAARRYHVNLTLDPLPETAREAFG
jgi:hypothetical protein